MIERINKPAGVYEAKGYSHAVKRGNIVFVAGQVSKDVDGKLVGEGDIVAQVEQVFRNLKVVVEASGATLADVVKLNIYTTDRPRRPSSSSAAWRIRSSCSRSMRSR
jgi:enamine deaminase RidA (YjgF/YER057c/UK114 family)